MEFAHKSMKLMADIQENPEQEELRDELISYFETIGNSLKVLDQMLKLKLEQMEAIDEEEKEQEISNNK